MNCFCALSLVNPGLGIGDFLELGAARRLCPNPGPAGSAGLDFLKAPFSRPKPSRSPTQREHKLISGTHLLSSCCMWSSYITFVRASAMWRLQGANTAKRTRRKDP